MKVLDLRDRLVDEYASYTRSFIRIADDRIREHVDRELGAGLLWPEPIVQLNPAFERGESIDELVELGVLHPECARIFRIKKEPHDAGSPLHLHRHQADAIKTARTGGSYVLTTGTGSGKSLAYIIPIVDRVLREGPGRGVKAIVAYPMNALANSQMGELEKFINYGYPNSMQSQQVGSLVWPNRRRQSPLIGQSWPRLALCSGLVPPRRPSTSHSASSSGEGGFAETSRHTQEFL